MGDLERFLFIIASGIISLVVLCLAIVDKGHASYYLMLSTPTFTIIHHITVNLLPSYRPSRTGPDASYGDALQRPNRPPPHTNGVYLAFLVLVSVLWSASVMTAFFVVGRNVEKDVGGVVRWTGPTECALGVVETGILWALFVKCMMNRPSYRYDSVSLHDPV